MTDYIDIAIGRVRIEANWNALMSYMVATGQDNMAALMNVGALKPSDIAPLMAACINEGERLDGRKHDWTALDLGAQCGIEDITKFITTYIRQITPKTADDDKKKE